jgi:hypothetical protein
MYVTAADASNAFSKYRYRKQHSFYIKYVLYESVKFTKIKQPSIPTFPAYFRHGLLYLPNEHFLALFLKNTVYSGTGGHKDLSNMIYRSLQYC